MTRRSNLIVAAFAAVSLGACASAPASAGGLAFSGSGGGGVAGDGVLDELPSHPAAGTCYARVKVIADAPPPGGHAVWRQNPGLPGSMGPTWCLVLEDGQAPPPPPPERFGWVKVLCDTDATPERVRHIQSKLHAHGDYQGAESGQYDQATADAVARFQQKQHIDHGGYLSLQTVEAIERAEVRQAAATGGPIHVACCQAPPPPVQIPVPVPVRVEVAVPYPVRVEVRVPQPYPVRVEVPVPQPYPVRVEVPVPQPYPVQVPVPQPYPVYVQVQQPCCQAPPQPQPCCAPPPPPCCQSGGYNPGYGRGAGYCAPAPVVGASQGGWLTWAGKSTF